MKTVKCIKCGGEYQLENHENINDFQCYCGSNLARQSKAINKSEPRIIKSQTYPPPKVIKTSESRKMETPSKRIIKKKINLNCPYCGHKIGPKAKSCYNCRREIKIVETPEELKQQKISEDLIIAIFATLNVFLILYFLSGRLDYIFGLFILIIFIGMYKNGKWIFKNYN